MSETCITKDLTDINFTPRDVIGYSFEVLTNKLLSRYGIGYNSNPLGSIMEWKKHQGKGVDFKIPELNIELEAKSGYAKIYRSWILRDWISRFSYHNEIRIVIVKPTLKLSNQCLELLFNYGINIIYPDSISYLVKRANKLIEAESNEKEVTNDKNESENSKRELDPSDLEKERSQNKEARTEEKTNGSTLNDYNPMSSEVIGYENNINLKNINLNIDVKNIETENKEARTEEKTNGSTFKEISFSSKEISFDSKENSGSEPEFSGNLSVERQRFLDETLSRCPYLNKNRIKSPKECPNRRYRILVCSLKMLNPTYVCIFRVLDLIRHHRFPSYIEKKGKIYICKNPKCTGEVCRSLELTCSFLVQINKCPRMYKQPHYSQPLPKPKILPSPDLTYYLNLQRDESKVKCKQIR
jgi:hypothetical protein